MSTNKYRSITAFSIGIVLTGCLIQAAGQLRNDQLVFPGVQEIIRAFFSLLGQGKTYERIGTTLFHLLQSLLLSFGIGVLIGLAEGLSDWVRQMLKPVMILFRSIPMIVLAVVLMVLLRYEHVPAISAVIILIPLFSEAVCEGCRRIDPELIDVYRMNSSINATIVLHVYLPSITGYLKQAFENAAGMGMKVVVSAEYLVQARNSLGKVIFSAGYFNEYAEIYAYALIMVLLVVIVSAVPGFILRCASFFRKKQESGIV